jgi:hypothetical protein
MTANARRSCFTALGAIAIAAALLGPSLTAQTPATPALHARSQRRLTLRNVMVIYGSARPPYGPVDIVIEGGLISSIGLPGPRDVSNYAPVAPTDNVQAVHGGGIEWTNKDGIPDHVPTLMREVRDMVSTARPAPQVHDAVIGEPMYSASHCIQGAGPFQPPPSPPKSISPLLSPRHRDAWYARSSTPAHSERGGRRPAQSRCRAPSVLM